LETELDPQTLKMLSLIRFEQHEDNRFLHAVLINPKKRALNRKVDMIASMIQALNLFLKKASRLKKEEVQDKYVA
jgi:CHASE1-domain containing sensor protein